MSVTPNEALDPANLLKAQRYLGSVLRGQSHTASMVLAALLGRGHILLEDVPGVGKTTMAQAVAKLLGNRLSRIQFTADLLPSDLLGASVPDDSGQLVFRPGPIFAQVVLADEINRASPKTQSALLEAMAEGAATTEGERRQMPAPFVVVATQNPAEQHGTYPLPESQLDRFAISLTLGYPSSDDELALLNDPEGPARALDAIDDVLSPEALLSWQAKASEVKLGEAAGRYLLDIVTQTRHHKELRLGCSPRGSLVFAAIAKAWAMLNERDFVTPDDIKDVAESVLAHRVVVAGMPSRLRAAGIVREIVGTTQVPR